MVINLYQLIAVLIWTLATFLVNLGLYRFLANKNQRKDYAFVSAVLLFALSIITYKFILFNIIFYIALAIVLGLFVSFSIYFYELDKKGD